MNFLKRALYGLVKNDSRNMGKFGNLIDSEWLQQEAQKNQEDPSKALRKSAMYAATIYGGGLLGGAAGAGANAAGQAAGQAGAAASQQAAMLAAQEAAKQGTLQGAGLLSQGGLTQAMTPGLLSTGPGSQAAMLAEQNAGFGLTGMARTADAAAGAQGIGMGGKIGSGMMNGLDKGLDMMAGRGPYGKTMRAMSMMNQPSSPPPPAPPPQQRPSGPPPPSGYGGNMGYGGLPPELAGLPPNDPRVIEFMKSRGM